MAPKKLKLDAYEQSIEDSIGRSEWKPLAGKEKAEFIAKLHAAHENLKNGHGGARPGAGRKPSGRRPVLLRLQPKTEARIRAEARRKGLTLGAVIDQWAAAA